MPLTAADLEAIGRLFDDKVKSIKDSFTASLDQMGKRVQRLEAGFSVISRVARTTVTALAKEKHDRLLRLMFDESTLVAVPPLSEDQNGKFFCPVAACSLNDVKAKISNIVGDEVKFEVKATNVGYRVMMASFSPQTRRKYAAKIVHDVRKDMNDSLGLYLQYDRPYELRMLQKEAYKFLSVLKKRGGDLIASKQLNPSRTGVGYFRCRCLHKLSVWTSCAPGWDPNISAALCSAQGHALVMLVNGMTFENSRFPARNDETLAANFCPFSGTINRENIPLPAWVRNTLSVPVGLRKGTWSSTASAWPPSILFRDLGVGTIWLTWW
jgi:hypothetical protein